jgi:glycosidase
MTAHYNPALRAASGVAVNSRAMLLFATAVVAAATALHPHPEQETARSVPAWVRDGVIYEVYPRAFSAQGGFKGVTAQLDELQDLGVTILWLMPINPIGKEKSKGTLGSPYAVLDYEAINPDYGTRADLLALVKAAHARDMKVVIDVVLNHTAWDSVLMKHPEYYKKDAAGKVIPPEPDWSDVAGLDYKSPELREYMSGVLARWVKDFDLDGFRCDVAGGVPTDFWEKARREIEAVKPDIVMIAEASQPDLLVKAFDLDYAWPFHSMLTRVLQGDAAATALPQVIAEERRAFPRHALHMRFSDDHDERRAIVRFGERGALAASALVFTLDGVPLLYNGMEVGDTAESGAPALFEKIPVFWAFAERRPEFRAFYKGLTALRRAHPALRGGDTQWVRNSDPDRILTFLRSDGSEQVLVGVNLSNRPFTGIVEAPSADRFKALTIVPGQPTPEPGLPALSLGAWEARVFARSMK